MKQIPTSLITLVAGVIVAIISYWVGQHHGLMPTPASEQAAYVDKFFNTMLTIATALFLVVEGAILISVIWFRRKAGEEGDAEPIEGNVPLEVFWTLIPAVIVIGLGVYSVDVYQRMGGFGAEHHQGMLANRPTPQVQLVSDGDMEAMGPDLPTFGIGVPVRGQKDITPDLVVDVKGIQYAWLFTYPATGVLAGELHVPVGRDIQLNLSADDVIHSFWVPEFRLKQDAIPGQHTQLRFRPTQTGEYPVICAELCGAYHGGMRTTVVVHEPEEFSAWMSENVVAQREATTVALSGPLTSGFAQDHLHRMGMTDHLPTQS